MTTDLQSCSTRLFLALRERDVPGPRTADAVAALSLGLGALVLGLLAASLVVHLHRPTDGALDPHPGHDRAPEIPRWAWGVMTAPLVLAVLTALLLLVLTD